MTAIGIRVPDIGADEAEITEILVKVGDKIETEQSLIIVEGDKASTEILSPQAGIVKEIKVSVGDRTQTSALIMISDSIGGATDAAPAQAEEKKEAAPTAAPVTATAKDANVPDIGSGEVEVTEILVKVGDKVEAERLLITVEGDEVSMEVLAPLAGTVKEIKANMGDKVFTGSLIMVFEVVGEAGAVAPAARQEAAPAVAPTSAAGVKKVNVPDIGDDEAGATEVTAKVGDKVTAEQLSITIEGDKASMEVPAPSAGVVKELKVNVGDKVKISLLIMILEVEGAAPAAAPAKQEAAAPAPVVKAEAPAAALTAKAEGKSESAENDAYAHVIPLTRRLIREFGVNLAKVRGTGRKGRTLREGVQAYVKEATKRAEAVPATTGGGVPGILPWPKVDLSRFGGIEEAESGCAQKTPGTNLSRNWAMVPYVTRFDKANITELEAFRKQQNGETARRKLDVEIIPVVFIVKAVAAVLERMLRFNSSLSEDGQRLILKKYINIGVAVDTPNGLVVSVFRDVDKKGIIKLSRELMITSKKVRDGKLTADEMWGGRFTIFSTGDLGTTHFAPIVNASEVVVLDVSESAMEPVWNGKELVLCLMLLISLSFDHRMIDGTDGARFITIINNTLSDIRRLVM